MLLSRVERVGFVTILRREIRRFLRIWIQSLIPSVISTALYLIIFGDLIGERIGVMKGFSYIEYILPGLVMMAIITNAYGNVVTSFYISRFQRNIEEVLVSPLSSGTILLGYTLGGVARGLLIGILVVVISLFFTKLTLHNISLTIFIAILVAMLFSTLGLLNALFAKNFDDINLVPTFVLTPLTYLGGVFYSVELLPKFWQGVTHANPIFYMINALRYSMLGSSDVKISMALSIILSCNLFFYIIALWMLRKGIGIRT